MASGEGTVIPAGAVYITAGVTVTLWLLSRAFEWYQNYRSSEAERRRYIKALYSEIDFNTKDMEEFIDETNINIICSAVISDRTLIPHITDARHTQIYKGEINLVHHVGGDYIKSVVNFYGTLEKIRSQIEGIQQESYKVISSPGRAAAIRRIYSQCDLCAYQGKLLLQEMEDCYPSLSLKRNSRPTLRTGLSISELKARSRALASALEAKQSKR